jgi:hypothetical protein
MIVNPVLFSTCGKNEALVFEWRVGFNANKGKGGVGTVNAVVGGSTQDTGHLLLKVGTRWKQCA